MVIRISSARHIDTLLEDLTAGNAVAREAAVARLIVVGGRAVDRLTTLAAMTEAPAAARLAAFRALEGIGDVRALDAALQATSDPDDQRRRRGDQPGAHASRRVAGDRRARPVDRHRTRRAHATTRCALPRCAPCANWNPPPSNRCWTRSRTTRGSRFATPSIAWRGDSAAPITRSRADWPEHPQSSPLPDEPETVRRHVSTGGDALSLAALHRLIETIRQREAATEGQQRREWMGARATVHVALARRGSRLGIYDLREALEAASRAAAGRISRRGDDDRRQLVPRTAGRGVLQDRSGRRRPVPTGGTGISRTHSRPSSRARA